MTTDRSRRSVAVAVLGALMFVAAACGSTTAPSATPTPAPSATPTVAPTPSPSPSAPAAVLVLRVTSEGGFIGPAATIASQPTISVYADGRIFTPGPIDAIAPSQFPSNFSTRDLGPAGAAAIVAALQAAGLDKPQTGGTGVPADTGSTIFTVTLNGETTVSRFSLGGGPGRPGGVGGSDPEQVAAGALLDRLLDESDGWGGTAPATTFLTPTAIRIFTAPGEPPQDPQSAQKPMAWPLSTPLSTFGTAAPDRGIDGLRSGVVFGADLPTLVTFLSHVNVSTPVTSGGQSYTIWVRPLLPDEAGG